MHNQDTKQGSKLPSLDGAVFDSTMDLSSDGSFELQGSAWFVCNVCIV